MKTARELKKQSLFNSSNWSRDNLYIFTEEQLDEFCEQLCLEQRHSCQVELNKNSIQDENGNWYVSCDDILKEEMPQL